MEDKKIEIKKSKQILSRLRKAFVFLLLFFVASSISLIILAQFQSFRSWTAAQILNYVNGELLGKIELGDIQFTSIRGIELYNARLLAAGDTVAFIPKLTVKFEPEALLNSKINAYFVELENPVIKLLRGKDSIWNLDKIAKPSTDTSSSKSKIKINVNELVLKNATFIRYDSLATFSKSTMLDYDHINARNLKIKLGANIDLSKNSFKAKIRELALKEQRSGLNIKEFTTNLVLNEDGIQLNDTKIITDEINTEFNVTMMNFNVFGTSEQQKIENAQFDLDFRAKLNNPRFVYYFTDLNFRILGEHDLFVKTKGTLNNLRIFNLVDNFRGTRIQFSGLLTDILESDKFKYDVEFLNTYFNRKDLIEVLPDFNLTSIPDYNYPNIDFMQVTGSTKDVKTKLKLSDGESKINGKVYLNFDNKEMPHDIDIVTEKLNLGRMFKNPDLNTNITGAIKIFGIGDFENTLKDSINLDLVTSSFKNYYFDKITINANTESLKIFNISNLSILNTINKQYNYDNLPNSTFTGSCYLDLTEDNMPKYKTDFKFKGFDLSSFFHDEKLPRYLSGSLKVNAKSFNLDTLTGTIDAKFDDFFLQEKAIFPFFFSAEIIELDKKNRIIDINSDNIKLQINGDFALTNLINTIIMHESQLNKFVKSKLAVLNPNRDNLSDTISVDRMDRFKPIDCYVVADIKDLTPFNLLIDSLKMNGNIKTNFHLMSTEKESKMDIDTISLRSFSLVVPETSISVQSSDFKGFMNLLLLDSIPQFDSFSFETSQPTDCFVDNQQFLNSSCIFDYHNKRISIIGDTKLKNNLNLAINSTVDVVDNNLKILLDSFQLSIPGLYKWQNKGTIEADFDPLGAKIINCEMFRDSAENLKITGSISNKNANDLKINISDYPLEEMFNILPKEEFKKYSSLKGRAKDISIFINGPLENPVVDFDFDFDNVLFNNYPMGNISAKLVHIDGIISGNAKIVTDKNQKLADIVVDKIPLYLGTKDVTSRYDHDDKSIVHAYSENFPLQIAEPFIPNISKMQGIAKAEITIEGEIDDLKYYRGKISVLNSQFLLEPNNMSYILKGDINLLNGFMRMAGCKLFNTDYNPKTEAGHAVLDGFIKMNRFDIDSISLDINANRIKLLSDASAVTMPDLYGDFVISSGAKLMHFYGTLDKPNLDGDVIIKYADIKMPLEQSKQKFQTRLKYQYLNDKVLIQNERILDTNASTKANQKEEKPSVSFADLMNYNNDVYIMGQFAVTMDMGLLGKMYSVIGTPNPNEPFRYVKSRDLTEGNVFGELELKKESTIKSFKILNTTGKISFPTGSISNPYLNILASYKGLLNDDNTQKNYQVSMFIVGPKLNPKITFSYSIEGVEATGDPEKISQDAIYLLITGRTKGSQGSQLNTQSLAQESSLSMVSGFTSQMLTNLIGSSFIQNADINFKSSTFSEATYKISGQIAGGVTYTLGGSFDNIMNNEISIDIPMSTFVSNPFWNNFLIQVSRAMNVNATITNREAKLWEVKFKLWGSE